MGGCVREEFCERVCVGAFGKTSGHPFCPLSNLNEYRARRSRLD